MTCLTYNMMVHTSTGQTPFFASFGRESTLPVHWVYTDRWHYQGDNARKVLNYLCWHERETARIGKEKCSHVIKFRDWGLGLAL